jgi:hypothetical protein
MSERAPDTVGAEGGTPDPHPLVRDTRKSRFGIFPEYEPVWPPGYPLMARPQLAKRLYEASRENFQFDGIADDWLIAGRSSAESAESSEPADQERSHEAHEQHGERAEEDPSRSKN